MVHANYGPFGYVISVGVIFLLLTSIAPKSTALEPPALSLDFSQHSAMQYLIEERQFLRNYIFDLNYGGAYFSVDGDGNVLNDSKDIIVQTNVILFLAGLSSENPDPSTAKYVESAASFVVNHLRWGRYGTGTWIWETNRTGSNVLQFPPGSIAPTEAYFSYGLLWAYKITGNRTYFDIARTNLDTEMDLFPDGHILADIPDRTWDATYRSPERMAFYFMWQLSGNSTYLAYARKVQEATYGRNALEIHDYENGTAATLYLHGNPIIDEAQYALVTGDRNATKESIQRVQQYSTQPHDDFAVGAEQGREYVQKLLAMYLALWTMTGDVTYHDAAVRTYLEFVKFQDQAPPYGLWSSLAKLTKTCFSRGFPLADTIPPTIQADPANGYVTANITDPSWQWLGISYRGIGLNPQAVFLFYSVGGGPWSGGWLMPQTGNGTFVYQVPAPVYSQNPTYLISASDYFNNTATFQFTKAYVPQQVTTAQQATIPPAQTATQPAAVGASPNGVLIGVLALTVGSAVVVAIALLFRRPHAPPPSPAAGPAAVGAERNLYCRCPYWVECARVHSQCPTCARLRQLGACCACYIMPPDHCNHPSGLGPVYGPHVDYGPNMNYHQPRSTTQ